MVVIFDIDGTLTRSCDLDARVYADAFARTFGVALPSTDWSDYADVTDQGVAEEAVDRLGLSREGIPAFKARFVEAIRARLEEAPIDPIPGARAVVADLIRAGHQVAFATGCWEVSARLKLESAGIDAGDLVQRILAAAPSARALQG